MDPNHVPIIDCDIHPYVSKQCPIDPFIPEAFREAVRQGLGGAPTTGYSNPFGVKRRDADCSDPAQLARDHLDRYGIAYGVLQPPGLKVSLTNHIDVGSALARAWNDWQVEHYLSHDPRLLGSICINVNDPDARLQVGGPGRPQRRGRRRRRIDLTPVRAEEAVQAVEQELAESPARPGVGEGRAGGEQLVEEGAGDALRHGRNMAATADVGIHGVPVAFAQLQQRLPRVAVVAQVRRRHERPAGGGEAVVAAVRVGVDGLGHAGLGRKGGACLQFGIGEA